MGGQQFTDTSDFFAIDYGDEILVGGKRYIVKGFARETRFGLEDPKFWVKRAADAETGERKFIKLTFFESFETSIGGVKIRCFRNPDKEGKILELVKNHPSFMNGEAYLDTRGNLVRVLNIVRGPSFLNYIDRYKMRYEDYFQQVLPGILKKLVPAFEAIRYLHINEFKHGDIRNDHIIVNRDDGTYVWIDFDYDYEATENPFGLDIFGLGSILIYAIGKGFHNLPMISSDMRTYGDLIDRIEPEDFSILEKWRFINLRKLYPTIPKMLNDILMHFSKGAHVYYEVVDELLEDLNRCLYSIFD
ncbi:MAG: protein kinase [Desulfobacteraceae bacterium]